MDSFTIAYNTTLVMSVVWLGRQKVKSTLFADQVTKTYETIHHHKYDVNLLKMLSSRGVVLLHG